MKLQSEGCPKTSPEAMAHHTRVEHESLALMVTKQMTTKIEIQGPLPDDFLRHTRPDRAGACLLLRGAGGGETLGTRLAS